MNYIHDEKENAIESLRELLHDEKHSFEKIKDLFKKYVLNSEKMSDDEIREITSIFSCISMYLINLDIDEEYELKDYDEVFKAVVDICSEDDQSEQKKRLIPIHLMEDTLETFARCL